MTHTLHGLVIRETAVKEQDKFLTVLTAELGKISVYCHGARSVKSRHIAAAQLFCYNEFVITSRGDTYTLKEAVLQDNFYALRNSFERLALAQYVVEVLGEMTSECEDCGALLRLALNTLYALSYTDKPEAIIKAAFELRAISEEGFMPDLGVCAGCGEMAEVMYLDVMNGHLICGGCAEEVDPVAMAARGTNFILLNVGPDVLEAMRYVLRAPLGRLFSFSMNEHDLADFTVVCERYFVNHMERSFKTLEFYNSLR